jgi:hypothetical protein
VSDIERWTITPAHHEDDDEGDCYTVGACIEPPLTFGSEPVEVVRADAYRGAVEAFAQERQAVLDAVNIYGDETLHKALGAIGWPANYIGGQ